MEIAYTVCSFVMYKLIYQQQGLWFVLNSELIDKYIQYKFPPPIHNKLINKLNKWI